MITHITKIARMESYTDESLQCYTIFKDGSPERCIRAETFCRASGKREWTVFQRFDDFVQDLQCHQVVNTVHKFLVAKCDSADAAATYAKERALTFKTIDADRIFTTFKEFLPNTQVADFTVDFIEEWTSKNKR